LLRIVRDPVGGVLRLESGERKYDAYGCVQIANANSDCVGPLVLPVGTLAITENDTWKALRIGMSGETMVTDGVKVAADVAYLPYVNFKGLDTHWQRDLLFTETFEWRAGRAA
jgi:outer membrane protease